MKKLFLTGALTLVAIVAPAIPAYAGCEDVSCRVQVGGNCYPDCGICVEDLPVVTKLCAISTD